MSYPQSPLASSVNTHNDSLAGQANLFLFDLKNEATEHGFKADESWTLQLATTEEITDLKRVYYPVVSMRLQPIALLQFFHLVKTKLQQPLSKADLALTAVDLSNDGKDHIAAYPAKRIHQ